MQAVLAAVRARILTLVASDVGDRVYPTHIVDVPAFNGGEKPVFPCVTFYWRRGRRASHLVKTVDPGYLVLQVFSQRDLQQAYDLAETIEDGLHKQERLISSTSVCVHECRSVSVPEHDWIAVDSTWRVTQEFLLRASVAT